MSFYHEGSCAYQQQFDGTRLAKRLEDVRVHHEFWPDEVEQINSAPFFFLASAYGDMVDCSYKGGEPGFVRVTGPSMLEWPDYDGNSMYRSLGNIKMNQNVGLLFVPFDTASPRLRINGEARIVTNRDHVARYPGAKLVVSVACRYIYKNCHRYIPKMILTEPSPFSPKPDYCPPEPDWKERDYARDVLPSPEQYKP